MESDNVETKDEIYKQKKKQTLTAVSFLAALKKNLDHETAFKISSDAFTNFMTAHYKNLLSSYKEGSQERFDGFRRYYEQFAEQTPYCKIIKSSQTVLKVKYSRCPFYEIMIEEGLEDLAYSFCLSDPIFTQKVLPGVIFSRNNEIVTGSEFCDHTWKFNPKKKK